MIHAKIAPLDPADSRVAARRLVNFGARVRPSASGTSMPAVAADLSAEGCRLLLCGADAEEGSAFWIKLPGIEARRASVAWIREGEAGCAFTQPLSPDDIAATRPRPHARQPGERSRFGTRG